MLLIALAAAPGCMRIDRSIGVHLPQGAAQAVVPLTGARRLLLAPVRVDGQARPTWWVVDTGATSNVVDESLARSMGLARGGKLTAITPTGPAEAHVVRVAGLRVGPVRVDGHNLLAADLSGLEEAVGAPVGGILGWTTLAALPCTLDYERHELIFHRPGAFRPPQGVRPIRIDPPPGLPSTEVVIDNRYAFQVTVDTGHNGTMSLTRRAARAVEHVVGDDFKPGRTVSLGGEGLTRHAVFDRVEALDAVLIDLPVELQRSIVTMGGAADSGTLGGEVLSLFRLHWDARRGLFWAEPRWSRRQILAEIDPQAVREASAATR